MKKNVTVGARLVLGLLFVVFGLNGFLQFIPLPPSAPEMAAFTGALFKTGYFFPMLKLIEIGAGVLLLSNKLVPLALAVLAPIVISIFAAHLFLDPAGLGMGVVLMGLVAGLAYAYKNSFAGVLTVNAVPSESSQSSASEVQDNHSVV